MLINWQSSLYLFYDGTKISNMAAGGHSNMAAVGNNKSILWSQKSKFSNIYV